MSSPATYQQFDDRPLAQTPTILILLLLYVQSSLQYIHIHPTTHNPPKTSLRKGAASTMGGASEITNYSTPASQTRQPQNNNSSYNSSYYKPNNTSPTNDHLPIKTSHPQPFLNPHVQSSSLLNATTSSSYPSSCSSLSSTINTRSSNLKQQQRQ